MTAMSTSNEHHVPTFVLDLPINNVLIMLNILHSVN